MEKVRDILRSRGINPSYQRMRIFEYLQGNKSHPTVDMIYDALISDIPTLSKTTIYNTLKLFAEKGIVSLLIIDQVELRVDPNIAPHAHLLCVKCGRIYDIELSDEYFKDIRDVGNKEGHLINEVWVSLRGVCKNCAEDRS